MADNRMKINTGVTGRGLSGAGAYTAANASQIVESSGLLEKYTRNKRSADKGFMDRDYAILAAQNEIKNIGGKVKYTTHRDENYETSSTPFYDPDVGGMVYPNENGDVRKFNADYIRLISSANKQIRMKVDWIMEMVRDLDDQTMIELLGIGRDNYYNYLRSATNDTAPPGFEKDDSFAKINGTVVGIRSTPPGSLAQAQALGKMRRVVYAFRNNINLTNLRKSGLDSSKTQAGSQSNSLSVDYTFDAAEAEGDLKATPAGAEDADSIPGGRK